MLDVDHRQFFTESSLRGLLDDVFGSSVVEQTAPIDRHLAGVLLRQPLRALHRWLDSAGLVEAALLLPPARARAGPPVTRVLFVSAEPVGPAMAGPAIRVVELARALAAHCEVTRRRARAERRRRRAGRAARGRARRLRRAARGRARATTWSSPSGCPPQLLRYVARLPVRFVADLYNPQMIEVLEAAGAGDAASSARLAWRSMLGQCAVADLVICASEKQRDLWLGGMGAQRADRLGPVRGRPHLPCVRGRGAVRAPGASRRSATLR